MTLIYTDKAEADLQAIFDYIAADSADRASVYLGEIENCILKLQDFPELGNL